MSDFNPWTGVNVNEGIDIAGTTGMEQSFQEYNDFEQMRRSALNISYGTDLVPWASDATPEMLTQSALELTSNPVSMLDDLGEMDMAFEYDDWRAFYEYQLEVNPDWQAQKRIWGELPPHIRSALQADGLSEPSDPHPGGIDIPFTSPFRKLANLIPGVDQGDGDFQILADTDNWFTTAADAGLDIPNQFLDHGVKPILKPTIEGLEWLEQSFVSRPLTAGQLKNEEGRSLLNQLGAGLIGGATGSTSMANIGAQFLGAGEALATGDFLRLYNLTQDNRGNFRAAAIDEATEILGGDMDQLVLAQEFIRSGGDPSATAEAVSGQPRGSEEFMTAFTKLYQLLPTIDGEDTDFSRAVAAMEHNKIGFHHGLAEQAGVSQENKYHGVVAGGFEIGTLVVLDPTMAAGRLNRLRKIAKVGVASGNLNGELRRTHDLAMIARGLDAGEEVAEPALRKLVLEANAHTVTNLRESVFAKMTVNANGQVNTGRRVDNFMAKVAKVADEAQPEYYWNDLLREERASRYMIEDLRRAVASGDITDDVDSVWRFFMDKENYGVMFSGALGRDSRIARIPMTTKENTRWQNFKGQWERKFDVERKMPQGMRNAIDEIENAANDFREGKSTVGEFTEAIKANRGEQQQLIKGTFGLSPRRIIRRTGLHVPRETRIHVGTGDNLMAQLKRTNIRDANEGILEFQRHLNTADLVGMADDVKAQYLHEFIQGNAGQRFELVRTFNTELLVRAGIFESSDEAAELVRKFGLGLDQHYISTSHIDEIMTSTRGTITNHTGIWADNLATGVAIPDFTQIQRAARHVNAVRRFGGDAVGLLDAKVSRFWKPMVILRMGFIARAAGEEALSFILRMGSLSYMQAQWGRRWAAGVQRNPVTGELDMVEDLSPGFARLAATGQQLKKWTRTRINDIDQLAVRQAATTDPDTARDFFRLGQLIKTAQTPAERAALEAEWATKMGPLAQQYLANKTTFSRLIAQTGDAAITLAFNASPAVYKVVRASRVIPSRQAVARLFMGNTDNALRGANRPLSVRPGHARTSGIFGDIRNGVEPEHLVMAQLQLMDNPSMSRAVAGSLGSTWGSYGVEGSLNRLNNLDSRRLTQVSEFGERVNMFGRTKYVPMSKPSHVWDFVETANTQAREALGFALMQPGLDPAMRLSGAYAAAHNAIGPGLTDELVALFGPDWEETITGLRQWVRGQLGTQADELADNVPYQLRRALVDGDDWPTGSADWVKLGEEGSDRVRNLVYPHADLLDEPMRPIDEALDLIRQRVEAYSQLPSYQMTLEQIARVQMQTGQQVVHPLQTGATRIYGVTIKRRHIEKLRALSIDQRHHLVDRLRLALQRHGLEPDEIGRISNQLLGEPGDLSFIDEVLELYGTELVDSLPASSIMFSNPDIAEDVARSFDEALRQIDVSGAEIVPELDSLAGVGFFDVWDKEFTRDRVRGLGETRNSASTVFRVEDAGSMSKYTRLDPDHKVVFAELDDGTWMDARQVAELGDEVTTTGRVQWANGMSEWAAVKELTNIRMREFENLYVGNASGDMLNEATGHIYGNTFDPTQALAKLDPNDLPAKVPAPTRIEADSLRWDRIVNGLFEGVLDPAMQGIIRTPHFLHNYASQMPFIDEMYHLTTAGKLNDRMLATLERIGVDDDRLADLLDMAHKYWRSPELADDHSDMAQAFMALADERFDPEEGAVLLHRAIVGTNDRVREGSAEMLDELIEEFKMRHGRMPSPLEEQSISNGIDHAVGRRIPNAPARETRLEDVRGSMEINKEKVAWVEAKIKDKRRHIRFLDNRLTQTTVDMEKKNQTFRDIKRVADEIEGMENRLLELSDEMAELVAGEAEMLAKMPTPQPGGGVSVPIWEDLMTQSEATRSGKLDLKVLQSEWDNLSFWFGQRHYRYQEAVETGAIRAADMTVEFIDDHRFRSQFQQTVRNLMPFWFAEEQFIKRQVRMLVDTPEAIRRATLLYNFGRASGVVDTNAEGDDIIVYPGTRAFNGRLAQVAALVTGMQGMEVYAQPMSGNVDYQMPGYNGAFLPNPGSVSGPAVAAVISTLAMTFPELDQIDTSNRIQGEVAQGRKPWEHFFPTSVNNLVAALGWGPFEQDKYGALSHDVIQMSMAAGLDPGPNATPVELEEYRARIAAFTRINLLMNAALYLGGPLPSSNRLNLGDLELSDEMHELLFESNLPWEEGAAIFMERNPDATPFMVFGTQNETGVTFAENSETYQFMDEHSALLKNNPFIAAYFIPPGVDDDKWSKRARDEALNLELRTRKTQEDLMTEIYFKQAAEEYYEIVEPLNAAIALAERSGNSSRVEQLKLQKSTFTDMFNNTHPVFAAENSRRWNRNEARRNDAKRQRDDILAMPREELPPGVHVDVLLELMRNHQAFNRQMDLIEGDGSAVSELRTEVRANFLLWAARYVQDHPEAKGYFSTHIRSDEDITKDKSGLTFEVDALLGAR